MGRIYELNNKSISPSVFDFDSFHTSFC